MHTIQLDIIAFSRAITSLGEAIAGFGRSIVATSELEEEDQSYGQEECFGDDPDACQDTDDQEDQEDQEDQAGQDDDGGFDGTEEPDEDEDEYEDSGETDEVDETDESDESDESGDGREDLSESEFEEEEPEPARLPVSGNDVVGGRRKERTSRAAEKGGTFRKGRSGKSGSVRDGSVSVSAEKVSDEGMAFIRDLASRLHAARGEQCPPGAVPSGPAQVRAAKAMGRRPMEAYVGEYMSTRHVSDVASSGSRYVGSDYLLGGRAVSLERLFSDGGCVVGLKGTRYYRSAMVDDLCDMYPAPACDKHRVRDPKPGSVVYVGLGEKGDAVARSFRKATVSKVHQSGMVDVVYDDSGTTGTCRTDQLSSVPSRK